MQHKRGFGVLIVAAVFLGTVFPVCADQAHQRAYVIELHDGQDPIQFGAEHHLDYIGPLSTLGVLSHFHQYRTKRGTHLRALEQRLGDAAGVRWFEEQHARLRHKRAWTPNDPLYTAQWHLHNTGPAGVRVDQAWHMGRTGRGVVIGIVDDGLQHTHPDLHPHYRSDLSHDYNRHDNDPMPSVNNGDFHGTSAAGVAAAACNNTHCGCGAAPNAALSGLRLIAGAVTDAQEAMAMSVYAHDIHIKSNSWGPMDDGRGMVAPGYLTQQAFAQSAQRGRNGKGTIFVWAAGNGRHNHDQCGYDGYASSPYTIAVGALNHRGGQSWYSESCAALVCVAPSSGDGVGITTTDVNIGAGHQGGYNTGHECNQSFGGTSSACPLAAGIIALLLEERSDLHWRDVQGLIANTSHIVDATDPDWSSNSNGYHHSHNYGFGRIDAPDLITRARTWTSMSPQQGFSSGTIHVNRAIPANGTPLCYAHTFSEAPMHFAEHVMLHVDIRHPHRGQVRVRLKSPEQVVSVFADQHPDSATNYPRGGWTFTSVRHWGERAINGQWTLCVTDLRRGNHNSNGSALVSFRLNVFGH